MQIWLVDVLRWVGAIGYLLQKCSLTGREIARGKSEKWFKWIDVAGWGSYVAGLIPIVIYLAILDYWIAAALELGGAPIMVRGFILAIRGQNKPRPRFLDVIAIVCTVLGIAFSAYRLGTLGTFSQFLELLMVTGFLVGTFQHGDQKVSGYFWYYLMFVSCGWMFYLKHDMMMFWQQVISAIVVTPGVILLHLHRRHERA